MQDPPYVNSKVDWQGSQWGISRAIVIGKPLKIVLAAIRVTVKKKTKFYRNALKSGGISMESHEKNNNTNFNHSHDNRRVPNRKFGFSPPGIPKYFQDKMLSFAFSRCFLSSVSPLTEQNCCFKCFVILMFNMVQTIVHCSSVSRLQATV